MDRQERLEEKNHRRVIRMPYELIAKKEGHTKSSGIFPTRTDAENHAGSLCVDFEYDGVEFEVMEVGV